MEALDNAWHGSWRPLTNLTQTFWACHLRTFNVAAIFFGVIPTYGVPTVHHDDSVWFKDLPCEQLNTAFEKLLPSTGL